MLKEHTNFVLLNKSFTGVTWIRVTQIGLSTNSVKNSKYSLFRRYIDRVRLKPVTFQVNYFYLLVPKITPDQVPLPPHASERVHELLLHAQLDKNT